METAPVWEKVFGQAPTCDKEVARTLTEPNLGSPERTGSTQPAPTLP